MRKSVLFVGSLVMVALLFSFQNCAPEPEMAPSASQVSSSFSSNLFISPDLLKFRSRNIDVETSYSREAKLGCDASPVLCGSVQGIVSDEQGHPFTAPGVVVSILEPTQVSFPFGASAFRQSLPAGTYKMGISIPDGYDAFVSACLNCTDHPESSFALYGHAGGGTLAPLPLLLSSGDFIDVRWRLKRNSSPIGSTEQALTCNFPGLAIPESTDAAKFIGTDVFADIGITRYFGGIATRLNLINRERPDAPLQVLESRSAAGSAWQSAYMAFDAGSSQTLVVNQAAGNMMQQWGYGGTYASGSSGLSQLGWNPMYTDHSHPAVDGETFWNKSTPHSPCFNIGYRFDDGQSKIVGGSRATKLGNVAEFENALSLKATIDQSWGWWAIDQALYLNKAAARQGDLRVYLPPPEGSSAKPTLVRPYEKFALDGASQTDMDEASQRFSVKTHPIPYAVLIWKVGGKDLGLVVRPSSPGEKFEAFLVLAKNALECSKSDQKEKGDACGNIEFHSYVYNSQLAAQPQVQIKAGSIRTYSMRYTLGTLDQLRGLGFSIP